MNSIPAVAFAAWSGEGKTALIEQLIREFKSRGLRIAVIKHDAHGIDIDREGKDTWRFQEAGADFVAVSSPKKSACIEQQEKSLEELISGIHDADLILIEGFKNTTLPRIGIARSGGKGFTDDIERFIAVVTDIPLDTALPCFEFSDIQAIADFIEEHIMTKNTEDFTHFNNEGRAKMVDVGEKPISGRRAVAAARVLVNKSTFELIRTGGMKKGDVLTVAQIAGVMGAKRTPDIIPMCHPILIDGIDLSLHLDEDRCSVEIEAAVSCDGRTGVEMEALTAVSTAALTVYDMCKAVQKDMTITDIRLISKSGGVHGDYQRQE